MRHRSRTQTCYAANVVIATDTSAREGTDGRSIVVSRGPGDADPGAVSARGGGVPAPAARGKSGDGEPERQPAADRHVVLVRSWRFSLYHAHRTREVPQLPAEP